MIFPFPLISTAWVVMVQIVVKILGGCLQESNTKKDIDITLNESATLSPANIESTSSSSEMSDKVISRSMHIKPL
jgi:hypothetical protein